jgi:hypothetical protein
MACLNSFVVLTQKEDFYLGVQIWKFGFLWKIARNLTTLLNQIHFAFVKSYWDVCNVFGRHVTQHICASLVRGLSKNGMFTPCILL